MQNYVADDVGRIHMTDKEALDVVGVEAVCIILPNMNVWAL